MLDERGAGQLPTVVVSAIAGSPGIGKTSLAVSWGHHAQDRFPDGQLYVNLRGYDPSPPMTAGQALGFFLRSMGLRDEQIPIHLEDMTATFRSVLAGRKMLVVLDNAGTAEQVRPLLPNEPGCAVLVTSRSRLSGLVAHDGAHRLTLDVLAPGKAMLLLRDVIGTDRANREPYAVAELARLCAYLPLALRIAAERVATRPHFAISDLVDELAAEHNRLDALASDDDEATAVRTVFSWSYTALPPPAARVFRLLGLHPGPDLGLDAVIALTGLTPPAARRVLGGLIAVHLATETGRDRFQLHDLLRVYAAERAATDESDNDRKAATLHLFEWYLHTAHAALFAFYPQHPKIPIDPIGPECQPLTFTGDSQARGWFAAEHSNLMAIIRHAPAVGQHTVGWQLPNAVDCYLSEYHHVADQITVHQQGLSAARQLDHQLGQRWAYGHLGEAYQNARRYDEAVRCHQHGLEIARQTDDEFGQGSSLSDLADCYIELRRCREAVEYKRQALNIYRAIGHQRNEALTLMGLGDAFRLLGEFDKAMTHLCLSLDLFMKIEAGNNQALTLRSMARVHHERGQNNDAIDHLQQAVALFREQHRDYACAGTLHELGTVFRDTGLPREARETWREAIAILADLDPEQATQIQGKLKALDTRDEHTYFDSSHS
ncbi:tetratricopeptide repeat protein [Amycolatopsis sp. NPDC004079]|uniref:ATP-binding protein n=1 Tax=Amycolatopsis sp. NPDC004079 TaxID=3154549 RepID=UPI0033B42A5D